MDPAWACGEGHYSCLRHFIRAAARSGKPMEDDSRAGRQNGISLGGRRCSRCSRWDENDEMMLLLASNGSERMLAAIHHTWLYRHFHVLKARSFRWLCEATLCCAAKVLQLVAFEGLLFLLIYTSMNHKTMERKKRAFRKSVIHCPIINYTLQQGIQPSSQSE